MKTIRDKAIRDGVTDMLAAAKIRLRAAEVPLAIGLNEAPGLGILADPEMARWREIIPLIPGFADIPATTLQAGMSEFGALSPNAPSEA